MLMLDYLYSGYMKINAAANHTFAAADIPGPSAPRYGPNLKLFTFF